MTTFSNAVGNWVNEESQNKKYYLRYRTVNDSNWYPYRSTGYALESAAHIGAVAESTTCPERLVGILVDGEFIHLYSKGMLIWSKYEDHS